MCFSNVCLQNLHQFVLAQGVCPAFSLSTNLPRKELPLNKHGLQSLQLEKNLLLVEPSDEDEEEFLDYVECEVSVSFLFEDVL